MTDKELVRRALPGDKRAQQECTSNGIALPCPCCGSLVSVNVIPAHTHQIVTLPAYEGSCFVECNNCTYAISGKDKKEALKRHNSRPAPPVGRCNDCRFYSVLGHCQVHSQVPDECGPGAAVEMLPDDFCSYFTPKEESPCPPKSK
mgnify:CR=1 FL=1